jgi:2-keto-4-pentenoate hydratase/2-oxohepta-3-ene-1,7-dioic acid hydratase in catechol pathway
VRLASFTTGSGPTYGLSVDDEIIDVQALARPGDKPLPVTLQALVEAGADGVTRLVRSLDGYQGERIPLDRVTFLPPIARPGKIICLALNNSANSSRILSGPSTPAFFSKPATALIGHGAAIPLRPAYGRVHPEPELAAIIGLGGKDIAEKDAYAHVFGYTVHNDITSPTMRTEDTYHYRAIYPDGDDAGGIRYVDTHVSYPGRYKGADGFAPMGPWIATRETVPDPHNLIISCWHGETLVTSDNTANLTHHLPAVIAWVSSFMTLEPGDIISLGTALSAAQKTGMAIQNVDLNRLGGKVTVEIEHIGRLTNPVSGLP